MLVRETHSRRRPRQRIRVSPERYRVRRHRRRQCVALPRSGGRARGVLRLPGETGGTPGYPQRRASSSGVGHDRRRHPALPEITTHSHEVESAMDIGAELRLALPGQGEGAEPRASRPIMQRMVHERQYVARDNVIDEPVCLPVCSGLSLAQRPAAITPCCSCCLRFSRLPRWRCRAIANWSSERSAYVSDSPPCDAAKRRFQQSSGARCTNRKRIDTTRRGRPIGLAPGIAPPGPRHCVRCRMRVSFFVAPGEVFK